MAKYKCLPYQRGGMEGGIHSDDRRSGLTATDLLITDIKTGRYYFACLECGAANVTGDL